MLAMVGLAAYGLVSLLSSSSGAGFSVAACGNEPTASQVNPVNGETFIQDNLWTAGRDQFAVWVGPGGAPFIGRHRVCSPSWQTMDLGDVPGNPLNAPTGPDGHDDFVVAVDSLGYVHVVGNMHGVPLRYIRSTRPREITSWTVGQMPGPAASVTYPQFVALPDGSLQFWYREGVSGNGQEWMDELPAGASGWTSMGDMVDGSATHESAYLNHIAVDPITGLLALMFEWRDDPDPVTTNDVGYAQSPDGGRTWETATGLPLTLPLTHDARSTVLTTTPTGSGLENNGGLTFDRRGRPHGVVVFGGATPDVEQLWFDGRRWHRESLGDILDDRPAIAATPDGRIWMLGTLGGMLEAVGVTPQGAGIRVRLARVPASWEAVFDSQQMAASGRIQVLIPNGASPAVVEADL
jgi:hypothetical protein